MPPQCGFSSWDLPPHPLRAAWEVQWALPGDSTRASCAEGGSSSTGPPPAPALPQLPVRPRGLRTVFAAWSPLAPAPGGRPAAAERAVIMPSHVLRPDCAISRAAQRKAAQALEAAGGQGKSPSYPLPAPPPDMNLRVDFKTPLGSPPSLTPALLEPDHCASPAHPRQRRPSPAPSLWADLQRDWLRPQPLLTRPLGPWQNWREDLGSGGGRLHPAVLCAWGPQGTASPPEAALCRRSPSGGPGR